MNGDGVHVISNRHIDIRCETGQGFRLENETTHQGRVYRVRGIDAYNRDYRQEVLNPEVDWFTWSSSMILDLHARFADDWQGRMKTLREDKAFLDNLFPVPVADRQSRSGPPTRGSK